MALLHEQLPARPQSIGQLRHAVVEFAGSSGASPRQCATIALAVSEALSNAVIHAYVDHDAPGLMGVDALLHERSLEVVVCDAGGGMRPRIDSPGSGLGLPLIASMTEQFEIRDTMPGVSVHMTFAID
jgi:anti-sigma regulatory factor (Ser/Thr protein kinase)